MATTKEKPPAESPQAASSQETLPDGPPVEEQDRAQDAAAEAEAKSVAGEARDGGPDLVYDPVRDVTYRDVPSIHVALSRVMASVQHVSKTERNTQQNYNFRGVDAVVNAVGPALREHGVIVVPVGVRYETERYTTSRGTGMKGVTATITFRFYGPGGDYIEAEAAGESSDSGDKAMPKAHSVAYRTLLLQALCIPTDDPDPDVSSHDRAADDTRGRAEPRNVAVTIPEVLERLTAYVEDGKPWVSEAVTALYPEVEEMPNKWSELPSKVQINALARLSRVVDDLDQQRKAGWEPIKDTEDDQARVRAAFSKYFEALEIKGPEPFQPAVPF